MPSLEIRYDTEAPTLRRFLASEKEVQFVMGPVGSGKTAAFIFKIFRMICDQHVQPDGVRRSRVIITRNTYPDLTSTTIRDWREIVKDDCGKFVNSHPPEHRLRFMLSDKTKVECDVLFIALDREDHVKKLRGMQCSFAWMNEAKEQPKAVLDMLTLRYGRYPREADGGSKWAGVLGDYNAPDEDHWLYAMESQWRVGELPDYEFFIQPGGLIRNGDQWVLNPDAENLKNLRPGYYEKGMQGKSQDYIKVNLANQYGFVTDGKPVHPDYVDAVHCWHEPLLAAPGIEIVVGMDYGLTPAGAFMQRQTNGRWHVIDEVVCFDMGAERFSDELHAKCATFKGFKFRFIGDPSGDNRVQTDEDTVKRVLIANKIPAQDASSNDVSLRREALGRPLRRMVGGKPGIIISPKCKYLRKGLQGGFCYKRIKVAGTERYHLEPEKNVYSHIVEALEYGLLDSGEKASVPATNTTPTIVVHSQPNWSPFDRR